MSFSFVKGHCGWDVVTLVPDGQIPKGEELISALKIVAPPIDGGLEVGFITPGPMPNHFSLRMVSSTARDWIPMCGGMTQVIGKALVESFLRYRFGFDASKAVQDVTLLTPSGDISIRIHCDCQRVRSITTTMDRYVSFLYEGGIETLWLDHVRVLRIHDYAVIDLLSLEEQHPHKDFKRRDFGPHLEIVNDLLRGFARHLGTPGAKGMLYDRRPEGPGQYRVFPRFYSDDLAAARVPWEFQCGTGSIAVAVALAHEDRLPFRSGDGTVVFEWGSYSTTPDPYGIRTSRLDLGVDKGRVIKAAFSHSVVEILTEGTLTLPGY
jgi:hypothetical protein